MDALVQFILPLKGLGDHQHSFDFSLDNSFFRAFPESPVADGQFEVQVTLDKRPSLMVLDFVFSGTIKTNCDRCLSSIRLPIHNTNRLLVKYGESDTDEKEEEDIIYISRETTQWSIAQFIYEYIVLAIPMIKVYDCEEETPQPCDLKLLSRLDESEPEEVEEQQENPIWGALKGWNKNK